MHDSALSSKRIVLQAGADDVEREFRSRNPNLDFRRIDQMQASTPTMAQIRRFAQEGQLRLA